MGPMLKVIATLGAALFTGGALYVSLVEHPVRMADMVIALRAALATEGDEISVVQPPNALAPFFDSQVRCSHLCNRVVIRSLAQSDRGVSFLSASLLIAASSSRFAE
jgi:hypothetical protein